MPNARGAPAKQNIRRIILLEIFWGISYVPLVGSRRIFVACCRLPKNSESGPPPDLLDIKSQSVPDIFFICRDRKKEQLRVPYCTIVLLGIRNYHTKGYVPM